MSQAEDTISLCLSATCVCVVAYAAIFCAGASCLGLEMPSVEPRGPGADCSEVEVPYEQEVSLHAPQPFWAVQCPRQCTSPHQLPQAVRLVQLGHLRPHDRRCSTQVEVTIVVWSRSVHLKLVHDVRTVLKLLVCITRCACSDSPSCV